MFLFAVLVLLPVSSGELSSPSSGEHQLSSGEHGVFKLFQTEEDFKFISDIAEGNFTLPQLEESSSQDGSSGSRSDSSLVFSPTVPDLGAGSETEFDQTGDDEFMKVCMWTFRQMAEVCHDNGGPLGAAECHIASIMGHSMQDEFRKFYSTFPAKLFEATPDEEDVEIIRKAIDGLALSGRKSSSSSSSSKFLPTTTVTLKNKTIELPLPLGVGVVPNELTMNNYILTSPPSIETCAWIAMSPKNDNDEEAVDTCPGSTIMCHIMIAEAMLLNSPDHFSPYMLRYGERLFSEIEATGDLFSHTRMWPIEAAFARFDFFKNHHAQVTLNRMKIAHQLVKDGRGEELRLLGNGATNLPTDFSTDSQPNAKHSAALEHELTVREKIRKGEELAADDIPIENLLSLDIVIARCDSPMHWLWEFALPKRIRIFIYEKCRHKPGLNDTELKSQLVGLESHVHKHIYVRVLPEKSGGPDITSDKESTTKMMSGECTAYLTYIQENYYTLADYTMFIHDDGPRHIRSSFVNIALQSIMKASYNVGFLHLTHERYAAMITPCFRKVYEMVFGEILTGPVTSYCCSNFIVGKERIMLRSKRFYERLADIVWYGRYSDMADTNHLIGPDQVLLVDGAVKQRHINDIHPEVKCNVRKKPCYVMEFLWHIVFGENLELPYRKEDERLPIALRYEGGRETMLPSPLKFSTYSTTMTPKRYTNKLLNRDKEEQEEMVKREGNRTEMATKLELEGSLQ